MHFIYTLLIAALFLAGCGETTTNTADSNQSSSVPISTNSSSSQSSVSSQSDSSSSQADNAYRADFSALNCQTNHNCFAFLGYDSQYGFEPWISDGTPQGTIMLDDINTTDADSNPNSFVQSGSFIYFQATTGQYGNELYVLDTQTSQVRLLHDLTPGRASSNIYNMIAWNNKLYFVFDNKLYQSDANTSEPLLISDIVPSQYASTDTWLYCLSNDVLYRTHDSTVETIAIDNPYTLWSAGDSLAIWSKTDTYASEAKLYTLSDENTTPTFIKLFEALYGGSLHAYFLTRDTTDGKKIIYFSDNSNSGSSLDSNYNIKALDLSDNTLNTVLDLSADNGGENIKTMLIDGEDIYVFASRTYSSSSGSYSPETGAVYSPSEFYSVLYRFDRNFGSKTLLHTFSFEAPNARLSWFAQLKEKIYFINSDTSQLHIFNTRNKTLTTLDNFDSFNNTLFSTIPQGLLLNDASTLLKYDTNQFVTIADPAYVSQNRYNGNHVLLDSNHTLYYPKVGEQGVELYTTLIDTNVSQPQELLANINTATLNSFYFTSIHNNGKTVMHLRTKLITTDYESYHVLKTFGPFSYKHEGKTSTHSLGKFFELNNAYYVVAPDENGASTIFKIDSDMEHISEIVKSDSMLEEFTLLFSANNTLYYQTNYRGMAYYHEGDTYFSINGATDEITTLTTEHPLSNFLARAHVPDSFVVLGDSIFYDNNNTITKMQLLKDDMVTTSTLQQFEGTIKFSLSDSNGFYFVITHYEREPITHQEEIPSTVEIWYSDGNTTSKLYTFQGINNEVNAIDTINGTLDIINGKLLFLWSEEVLSNTISGTGVNFLETHYKTYVIDKNATQPTEILDEQGFIFAHPDNLNIILMTQATIYDETNFPDLKYWLYNLKTGIKTPILQE